jgi:hypothetical protein
MQLTGFFSTTITTIAILSLSLISVRAQSTNQVASPDGGSGAILVELFTSEGCSSCPPADALLREVDGKRADSGQLIVGVSEHVTYWNHLGWSDPFSNDAYTERQNAYGERFRLDSVYTPQIVINGEDQIVGSDSRSLLDAVQKKWTSPLSLHISSTHVNDKVLTVGFSLSGSVPSRGVDIFAIVADDMDKSNVARGENSGHTLTHVSVARSIMRVASLRSSTERSFEIPLPDTMQARADQRHHLILFAQSSGLGRVLGVDTKPL